MPELDLSTIDIATKKARHQEILQELTRPEIVSDYKQVGELNSELKDLDEVITTYEQVADLRKQVSENEALLNDPEFAELAGSEIKTLNSKLETLTVKLADLTATKLPDDEKNAIMEIRAGTGGTEAALFAEEIQRMYLRYLTSAGLTTEHLHTSLEDAGGVKEVIFRVVGRNAFGKLRFESGVHRVQRVPVTEANGRIHTSAISVVVLPEIPEAEIDIPQSDLRVDVYRSSGAGGQGVNRTDSAVRITHIPTGIIVTCQDSRSQHKNKEKALSVLASKLYAIQQESKAQQSKDIRSQSIQSGDRSAKIRTYNFPQGRVTDHRIGKSWFNLAEIMEGEVGDVIDTVNKKLRAGEVAEFTDED